MKKLLYNIPTGLCSMLMVALITYLSLSANPIGANELLRFPHADKLAHAVAYFVCTLVFLMDYAKYKLPHHTKLSVEMALACMASLLGLMLEVAQLVTESRSYDLIDWGGDTVGAIAGFLVARHWLLHHFRKYFYHTSLHYRRKRCHHHA